MANVKQAHLDRLAQLSADDLTEVVRVVERATIYGDGWLQRLQSGAFRARDTRAVLITERPHIGSSDDPSDSTTEGQ